MDASHQIDSFHDDAILLPDDRLNYPDLPSVMPVHDVHLVAAENLPRLGGFKDRWGKAGGRGVKRSCGTIK